MLVVDGYIVQYYYLSCYFVPNPSDVVINLTMPYFLLTSNGNHVSIYQYATCIILEAILNVTTGQHHPIIYDVDEINLYTSGLQFVDVSPINQFRWQILYCVTNLTFDCWILF